MADINKFIDHIRDIVVQMPAFTAVNLTKKDIARRYNPMVKDRRPEDFPAIALIYDFNLRERWAPIDKINFIFQIEMKAFDDVQTLAEAIRDQFDRYSFADANVNIFIMWHNGGDAQPSYNKDHNTYWSILKFETRLGDP